MVGASQPSGVQGLTRVISSGPSSPERDFQLLSLLLWSTPGQSSRLLQCTLAEEGCQKKTLK